jgi:hypothetical protein
MARLNQGRRAHHRQEAYIAQERSHRGALCGYLRCVPAQRTQAGGRRRVDDQNTHDGPNQLGFGNKVEQQAPAERARDVGCGAPRAHRSIAFSMLPKPWEGISIGKRHQRCVETGRQGDRCHNRAG